MTPWLLMGMGLMVAGLVVALALCGSPRRLE